MRGIAGAALVACAMVAGTASADPLASPATRGLVVQAAPIFRDAPSGVGWSEVVVSLENPEPTAEKGTLEVTSTVVYGHEQALATRAPFHVAAGRTVVLHLPTHAAYSGVNVTVSAVAEDGYRLAVASVSMPSSVAPVLVDVDDPSRLSVVLRNASADLSWTTYGVGGGASPTPVQVASAAFDSTTGDPILPDQASGYAGATVVLLHSAVLARLEAAPLDALVDWVLAGGTLAVVPSRADDLRGAALEGLLGGTATATDPPSVLLSPSAWRERSHPSAFGGSLDPSGGVAVPTKSPPSQVDPTAATRARLTGYTGGNLHASPFGATATYGLGEVHLLGFDPTAPPLLDDPWMRGRMVDLVTRAWDRRSVNAVREGSLYVNPGQMSDIRRWLDPNENFRPALGISAMLLVLYSIVVGPVAFLRAKRIGKPLRPLLWAPLLSAVAFGSVVLVGFLGRGWHGRARRLSLVEAGAGMSRGAVRRYRGFFTSRANSMSIAATDSTCMLDVVSEGDLNGQRTLRVDRNGVALERVTSLPWQTIVVIEDGSLELGAGVSLTRVSDAELEIVNRSGKTLEDLVVYVPGRPLLYFAELKDGERQSTSKGQAITTSSSRRSVGSAVRFVHPLDASDLGSSLDAATAKRVRDDWRPFENAGGSDVDWWPDDQPVLLAEVAGGEGRGRDSGLSVEQDRQFLRVVGLGESP